MNTARRVPQRTITALFDVYSSDLQEGRATTLTNVVIGATGIGIHKL